MRSAVIGLLLFMVVWAQAPAAQSQEPEPAIQMPGGATIVYSLGKNGQDRTHPHLHL